MLAKSPIDINKIDKNNITKGILRISITAELDAISLYEQMADMTENKLLKRILLDVAKEEKTHIGEFETLLLKFDSEQEKELENGSNEVNNIIDTEFDFKF